MSKTTLLKDGCPCTSESCDRKGDCAACIRHHVENTGSPTSCMKPIVEKLVAQALEKK